MDSILAAAYAHVPTTVGTRGGFGVGILTGGLTRDRARVGYYNREVFEVYEFRRGGGAWQRQKLLERRAMQTTPGPEDDARYIYSSSIATLFDQYNSVRDNDWITPHTATGCWTYSEEYQSNLPYSAQFNAGSEQDADTTYQVSFSGSGCGGYWRGERLTQPAQDSSVTCATSSCDISVTYSDSLGLHTVGSQKATVQFYLHVQRPVYDVTISGPTSISGVGGQKDWSVTSSGGDGVSTSYVWEFRYASTSTWTQVGTGTTYSRTFGASDSNNDFYLRVTATSGSESAQSSEYFVNVDDIADPLLVAISGPSVIETTGNYTWTSSVSGGTSPYSYQWQYCYTGCTNVGTGTSYTRYVQVGDPEFTLKLIVTDSGTGAQAQVEEDIQDVYVAQGGGVFGPQRSGGGR